MSETAACRSVLAKWCQEPFGLDLGAGGDRIVPHAWTFDMPQPYTAVAQERQILRGDSRNLSFICDGALDWVYSAHLLEDFWYAELVSILKEWRRVLKVGGLLVTNCPDQQRFLAWCAKTGQGDNLAHKEQDFSLDTFRACLTKTGLWEDVFELPDDGRYSFYLVVRKVE